MMKKLEAPKGYELLRGLDYYAYYLSHEDRGIIGGLNEMESGRVALDLFKNGDILPIVANSISAALEFSGDLERMKELGKL
jgi:hypothetical protein